MNPNERPRFGALPEPGRGTRFNLWAPSCRDVTLELLDAQGGVAHALPLAHDTAGWWTATVADGAGAGARYRYRVSPAGKDTLTVPDPASRSQPDDVHGPSEVVDPAAYRWRCPQWTGRPWAEAVVYELHVGTFTPEGTFEAAAARLPQLKELGITAVELMPIADFPGQRNWGYDGVLPYAPDRSYGTPEQLKSLVDTAHELGLMILLDVVYNHFGPDGNYLSAFAPEFFDESRHTPWGSAIAFDGPNGEVVRRFFVDNAVYWVTEYRFDGLRLDAVHAITDGENQQVLHDIGDALRAATPGRHVHLVLENEHNTARLLAPRDGGRPPVATAQWNDDIHHAAHVLATGERDGYYVDFADEPLRLLAHGLAEGFIYQGQPSGLRDGEPRGEPSKALPATCFINFLQNHDQVGNRAFGERLDALADTRRLEALWTMLLLSPPIPMLFMGDEFGAGTPFQYFCDATGDLARAITEGRRREFARFAVFADPAARERIPDPNAVETFRNSKLDWASATLPGSQQRTQLIRQLLTLRAERLVPLLPAQNGPGEVALAGDAGAITWRFGPRTWRIAFNFGSAAWTPPGPEMPVVHALRAHDGRAVIDPNGVLVTSA